MASGKKDSAATLLSCERGESRKTAGEDALADISDVQAEVRDLEESLPAHMWQSTCDLPQKNRRTVS